MYSQTILGVIKVYFLMITTLILAREIDEGKSTEDGWNKAFCHYQPETGNCKAYIRAYYYNITKGDCEEFIYGGCPGNSNIFSTKTRCMQKCGDSLNRPSAMVVNKHMPVCHLQADTGPCLIDMEMYYYDIRTESCKIFSYGGCLGNGNRFDDEESCLAKCKGSH